MSRSPKNKTKSDRVKPLTLPPHDAVVAAQGNALNPRRPPPIPFFRQSVDLTGAERRSYPIYSKWCSEYANSTGVKINYQSIGSGGGIRQLSEETVDFGASDSPMSDEELAKAKGGPVLHIPTVLGADVVTYNLPGVTTALKFTPEAIAGFSWAASKSGTTPALLR